METKDIFILCIAGYGAILSTLVFILQRLDKISKIKIGISRGFITTGLIDTICIEASNHGEKTVTLSSGGITLPDRVQIFKLSYPGIDLPHELLPGKSITIWFEARPLAAELTSKGYSGKISIRGRFRDQTSREYVSKKMKFDINRWISKKDK